MTRIRLEFSRRYGKKKIRSATSISSTTSISRGAIIPTIIEGALPAHVIEKINSGHDGQELLGIRF
jgi:hypothetical protein